MDRKLDRSATDHVKHRFLDLKQVAILQVKRQKMNSRAWEPLERSLYRPQTESHYGQDKK